MSKNICKIQSLPRLYNETIPKFTPSKLSWQLNNKILIINSQSSLQCTNQRLSNEITHASFECKMNYFFWG